MVMYTRWTNDELEILKQLYPTAKREELELAIPEHNWTSIVNAAKRWKLTRMSDQDWSQEEEVVLLANYKAVGAKGVAALLGRSLCSVTNKAFAIGIRVNDSYKRWTAEDEELMRQHYATTMPISELATLLGRKQSDVVKRAQKLLLKRTQRTPVSRKRGPRKTDWPAESVTLLRQHYETAMPVEELAELLGKKAKRVTAYANKLGMKRRDKSFSAKAVSLRTRPKNARVVAKKAVPVKAIPVVVASPPKPAPKKRGKYEEDTSPGSAAYIRDLPYAHPERMAFLRGGGRKGWEEFMNSKKAEKPMPSLDLFQVVGGSQPGMEGTSCPAGLTFNHVPEAAYQREEVARG